MQLNDLSEKQQGLLKMLHKTPEGLTHQALGKKTCFPSGTVGSSLKRLLELSFVEKPLKLGGAWRITLDGVALIDPPGKSERCENALPAMIPALTADLPDHEEPTRDEAVALLPLGEVESALRLVRTRLQAPLITARARVVYTQVLEVLPPILVDELAPITAWVEAHL